MQLSVAGNECILQGVSLADGDYKRCDPACYWLKACQSGLRSESPSQHKAIWIWIFLATVLRGNIITRIGRARYFGQTLPNLRITNIYKSAFHFVFVPAFHGGQFLKQFFSVRIGARIRQFGVLPHGGLFFFHG